MENRYVEVYFNDRDIPLKVNAKQVYSVEIEDGFLKIFDKSEKFLHCYNINSVNHYHVPDEVFGKNL